MKLPALILAVMAVTLLAASARSQEKANPPTKQQTEESAKKIKELQKQRIDTLKDLVETLTKLAQNARVEFGEVLEAQMMLLKAELDAAEKESDRIAIYKKTIEVLKQHEEFANKQKQMARGTHAAVLKVQARRLEVEIALEQAKMKEAKEGK